MMEIGKIQKLKVIKEKDFGIYLSDRPIQRRTEERRQQSGKETFRQLDTPYSKRCAIIFLKKFRIRCSICS